MTRARPSGLVHAAEAVALRNSNADRDGQCTVFQAGGAILLRREGALAPGPVVGFWTADVLLVIAAPHLAADGPTPALLSQIIPPQRLMIAGGHSNDAIASITLLTVCQGRELGGLAIPARSAARIFAAVIRR